MPRFLIVFTCAFFAASAAQANCNSREVGGTTFTRCDDGTSYTAREIGGTTFYSGDINATSRTVGGTTFHSGDISGTSREIGGTTFHNLDGVSGTSREIGGTTFYNFDNGVSGTARTIGGTRFSHTAGGALPAREQRPFADREEYDEQINTSSQNNPSFDEDEGEEVRW